LRLSADWRCSEKYFKKLAGRTDLEDALRRLDKLTQEEARMATAEVLKATQTVDERVMGVADQVDGVNDRVATVDNRLRHVNDAVTTVNDRVSAVDDKVTGAVTDAQVMKRQPSPSSIDAEFRVSHVLVGNQLWESLHRWLSPPDPSTNHNIACRTHHKRTATWFFQGSIFEEWKKTGSLLWIHGKRAHLFHSLLDML
jgi:hypothetical protein